MCLSGGLIARALAERGVKVPAGRLEVAAAAGLITEAKLVRTLAQSRVYL